MKHFKPHPTQSAVPTLDDRLRYIDLSLECSKEAHRLMPSPPSAVFATDEALPPRNLAREALIRQLRIKAVLRAGLPIEVLPEADRAEIGEVA